MNRLAPCLAALALGCTTTDGCYPVPPEPPFDCTQATFYGHEPDFSQPGIYGHVTSPSGDVPVAGAEVVVDQEGEESTTFSGEGGCFHLDLDPGDHDLQVTKGRYGATLDVDVHEGPAVDIGAVPLDDGGVRMAVVHGKYDDVGRLIGHLGIPFDTFVEPDELYGSPGALSRYDVVFANCGSTITTQNEQEYTGTQFSAVRSWVEGGGTLYVSDWEYELFEGVAPEAVEFAEDARYGPEGTIMATVLDRDIVALLGTDQAEITYDLMDWAVIESAVQAIPLVEGTLQGATRPLAVLHHPGDGRMIFTTFHNDAQMTEDMAVILYELILYL